MKSFIFFLLIFIVSCGRTPIDLVSGDSNNKLIHEWDWSHIDLDDDGVYENYVTGIKSQNGPDCVLFAAVGTLEIQYRIDNFLPMDLDLSEQNVLNCTKKIMFSNDETIDYLRIFGVMEERFSRVNAWMKSCNNCMSPYKVYNMGNIEVDEVPFYGLRSVIHIDLGKSFEKKKESLMKALYSGPLAISVDSWDGFIYDTGALRMRCKEKKPSGHEVILVGYRNDGDIFLVKNSHADGRIKELIYNGSDVCGFASSAYRIDGTWMEYGKGKDICFSTMDTDKDGVWDVYDNCPYVQNIEQSNRDGDLLGDICDECPDAVVEDGNPWNKSACPVILDVEEMAQFSFEKTEVVRVCVSDYFFRQ